VKLGVLEASSYYHGTRTPSRGSSVPRAGRAWGDDRHRALGVGGGPSLEASYTAAMKADSVTEHRRAVQDALAQIRRLRRQEDLPDLDAARLMADVRAEREVEGTKGAPPHRG